MNVMRAIFTMPLVAAACGIICLIWHRNTAIETAAAPNANTESVNMFSEPAKSGAGALITFNRARSPESVSPALQDFIRRWRSEGRFSEQFANWCEKACTDLPGCFAEISVQDDPNRAERRKSDVLQWIARYDLTYLTEGLPLLANNEERQYVLSGLVATVAKNDPAALVKYAIEHFDKRNMEKAILSSIPVLAKNGDIEAATSAVSHVSTAFGKKEAIQGIAKSLAEQYDSPSIALRWAQSLATADEREAAELAILGTTGKNMTPENLAQMMGGFHEPKTQTALVAMVVTKLVAQDANAALEWVKSLPEEMAGKAQPTLAIELAKTNLEKATEIALAMPGDGRTAAGDGRTAEYWKIFTIDQIANVTYKKDPKQLSQWVAALPSSLRERSTGTLARNWIRDDSASAKTWILGLPDGEEREIALGSAATVFGLDPALSSELISLMKDPKRRAAAQHQIEIVAASLKAQGAKAQEAIKQVFQK